MNSEVKKLWIDALRSGEYKQTMHALHDDDGFCCLGVLCDLHRKHAPDAKEWIKHTAGSRVSDVYLYNDEGGILPPSVRNWAGLKYENPCIFERGISQFNDSGHSFDAIADLIEEHL